MKKRMLFALIISGIITGVTCTGELDSVGYAEPLLPGGQAILDSINSADPSRSLQQLEEARARQQLQERLAEQRSSANKVVDKTGTKDKDKSGERAKSATISFQLKKITTDPSQVLSEADINSITSQFIGKTIKLQDLYTIVDKFNDVYGGKGYLTCRAFLQPQTVQDGVVKITLVEGRVEDNQVKGIRWTKPSYITDRLHTEAGKVPNINTVNKDLLRFNATNGLQLHISLKPGSKPGTTDVVIDGKEPNQQSVTLFTDNAGNQSSGTYRGGLFYNGRSISGIQDNLTLGTVFSKGTKAVSLNYSVPVGLSGTRMNVGYSTNAVHTVEAPTGLPADYIRGHANAYSLALVQPWIINENTRSEASLELNRQNAKSDICTDVYTPYLDNTVTDGTLAFAMTNFGGSSVYYQRHGLTYGMGKSFASTAGDYNTNNYTIYKFNGFYQKAYKHGQAISYRLEMQKSFTDNLLSAKQFFIGGMYTVRGYKESYMGGDSGLDMSLEYQLPINKARTINSFLFLDYGITYGGTAESNGGDRALASAGIGVKANIGKNVLANLVVGFPLKRTFASKDEEVSKARVHFMLSGSF